MARVVEGYLHNPVMLDDFFEFRWRCRNAIPIASVLHVNVAIANVGNIYRVHDGLYA